MIKVEYTYNNFSVLRLSLSEITEIIFLIYNLGLNGLLINTDILVTNPQQQDYG